MRYNFKTKNPKQSDILKIRTSFLNPKLQIIRLTEFVDKKPKVLPTCFLEIQARLVLFTIHKIKMSEQHRFIL